MSVHDYHLPLRVSVLVVACRQDEIATTATWQTRDRHLRPVIRTRFGPRAPTSRCTHLGIEYLCIPQWRSKVVRGASVAPQAKSAGVCARCSVGQLRRSARPGPGAQGFHAPLAAPLEPLAYRGAPHFLGRCDVLLPPPALLMELPSVGSSLGWAHASTPA